MNPTRLKLLIPLTKAEQLGLFDVKPHSRTLSSGKQVQVGAHQRHGSKAPSAPKPPSSRKRAAKKDPGWTWKQMERELHHYGEVTVQQMAYAFKTSPAVQRGALQRLVNEGKITATRRGKKTFYSLPKKKEAPPSDMGDVSLDYAHGATETLDELFARKASEPMDQAAVGEIADRWTRGGRPGVSKMELVDTGKTTMTWKGEGGDSVVLNYRAERPEVTVQRDGKRRYYNPTASGGLRDPVHAAAVAAEALEDFKTTYPPKPVTAADVVVMDDGSYYRMVRPDWPTGQFDIYRVDSTGRRTVHLAHDDFDSQAKTKKVAMAAMAKLRREGAGKVKAYEHK